MCDGTRRDSHSKGLEFAFAERVDLIFDISYIFFINFFHFKKPHLRINKRINKYLERFCFFECFKTIS